MADKNHVELSDDNLDGELASTDKLFLIDFWNESCIPCRRMAPMLDELAVKFQGRLKFAKLNVDNNPKIVERFNIRGVPTFLFIKNGVVLERFSGVIARSEFIKLIEKNL